MINTKTIIQFVTIFNCEDKSEPSDLLQNTISQSSIFKLDNEEMLFQELEKLGFTPKKVDAQLVDDITHEISPPVEVLMVDDPCVGSVLLYLNKDQVSIH